LSRSATQIDRGLECAPGKSPGAAAWARRLVEGLSTVDCKPPIAGADMRIKASDRIALASFEVPAAASLDEEAFRDTVECGYRALAAELGDRSLLPLRFWNFVPNIGEVGPSGLSGYELFNQARRDAFERPEVAAMGRASGIAASAVDTRSGDLSILVLAADQAPDPLDNPRQIEPHAYSARYGPVPPRFARGVTVPRTLVRDLGFPEAIVSGTASIVGEDTRHAGDLEAQLVETAVNLASVALAFSGTPEPRPIGACLDSGLARTLGTYSELRIYVPRQEDEAEIGAWADEHFDTEKPAEIVSADLCRPDLLVEAEGILRTRG
jgi:chorismate lyase/3-hydroxybenzoate synthase